MNYSITGIELENFKSYLQKQRIVISDLSVLLGANSSGKSSALQSLLVLKQTMECNSPEIDLLLSGKYVTLGEFTDVLHDKSKKEFTIKIDFNCNHLKEDCAEDSCYSIKWFFKAEGNESHAILRQIDIEYDNQNASYKRVDNKLYQFIINGKQTPIHSQIRNLTFPSSYCIKYDKDFNKLFANFINEMKLLVEGPKTQKVSSTKLVSFHLVPEFYLGMLKGKNNDNPDAQMNNRAEKMCRLIEDYAKFQNPMGSDYYSFPFDLKVKCMVEIIMQSKKPEQFDSILLDYSKRFEKFVKEHAKQDISKFDGEEFIPSFSVMHGDDKQNNANLELFCWIMEFYQDFENALDAIFFVGPLRETPRGLYNIGFENVPKYVGPTGSNFASVLLHENKRKMYLLPEGEECEVTLLEALGEWSKHLNIASAVMVNHENSFGINVSISNTQDKESDIMNVGIGTSQVLPVLIAGLLSEPDETLIFEQPELHLHPYSQSRLADFFIALISNGRKVIIETHSEAFILRLRYHILCKRCFAENVAINFFINSKGTKVSQCNISGYGNIEYPKDFRDETQELLNELLQASLIKAGEQ